MVLERIDSSWYNVRGTQPNESQYEILNEESKTEIYEDLLAGHERWKMSFDWKTEDSTIKRYEKKIISDFGESFDKIGQSGLADVESVVDDYCTSTNKSRIGTMVDMMEEDYDVDLSPLIHFFQKQNEKYQKKIKITDEIFKKEWERFVKYEAKKAHIQKKIKDRKSINLKDDIEEMDIEEQEYRQKITDILDKFLKTQDLCKAAKQLLSGKGSDKERGNKEVVRQVVDETRHFKKNLMKIISLIHEGLLELRERKDRTRKKLRGFIDEQCDICQENEAEWEDERLRASTYGEPLTAKDARRFHTRMVRSGGMRGLVDKFKSYLDDNPPADLALPTFVAGMVHPEKTGHLYRDLVSYNCMKLLREELHKMEQEKKWRWDRNLFEKESNEELCGCIFCESKFKP